MSEIMKIIDKIEREEKNKQTKKKQRQKDAKEWGKS